MKIKINIFLFVLLWSSMLQSQTQPTGTPISVPQNSNPQNNQAWFRGGNLPGGTGGSNNIFGTNWNSPIYTTTNGAIRMKHNGNLTPGGTTAQYTINGFGWSQGVNTSGYVGIGQNLNNVWSNKGPFSMLHLNGEGTFVQELGYRPWMKTGISITSNNDFMYMTNL